MTSPTSNFGPPSPVPSPTSSRSGSGLPSPSFKRALDFDFWEERKKKIPKIVQQDLDNSQSFDPISKLNVSSQWEDTLLLKCVVVRQFPKVLKLFCTDGENKIAVIAFGKEMEQLKALTLDNSVFSLSCIQVNAENSAYATGSFNGLEIILTSGSQIKVVEQKEITFPYEFTSVQEAKSKDDSQFIDVLCILSANFGIVTTSKGKTFLELSLTDETKASIGFTIFQEDIMRKLEDKESIVLKLGNVQVASYNGKKYLKHVWSTVLEIEPEDEKAKSLSTWYQNALLEADSTH